MTERQRIADDVKRRFFYEVVPNAWALSDDHSVSDVVNFVLNTVDAKERELRLAAERERDEALEDWKDAVHESNSRAQRAYCAEELLTAAQQEVARLRQELRNSRETTEQTNADIWAALNGDNPICGPVTATAAIIKLRAERDEARGRAELAAHNGKVEYQRAEDYWKQLAAAQQENARLKEALENLADCTGAVAERFRYVRTDIAEARAHNRVMQALGKAVRQARAALSACEETSGEPSELEDDDA